jgi:hypothetical protein
MEEEDSEDQWDQEPAPLSSAVWVVLGQHFDFEDEIIEAVVRPGNRIPQGGDFSRFDNAKKYVENPPSIRQYLQEWSIVLRELKHRRRFFSPAANVLFDKLFGDIERMRSYVDRNKKFESVVYEMPIGTELFRARTCDSDSVFRDIFADPYRHAGPPPAERARAGRMNAEGVVVFYGATDYETALAEMRPAIGGITAVITMETTKRVRLLDFTRLKKSISSTELSYLQPDFPEQAQRRRFLRRLHKLISQPIVPGRESEYVITQTMAEHLAHVHEPPFDGVLFGSVQRSDGVNVVLFPAPLPGSDSNQSVFAIKYKNKSAKLFSTDAIQYKHTDISVPDESDDSPDDLILNSH